MLDNLCRINIFTMTFLKVKVSPSFTSGMYDLQKIRFKPLKEKRKCKRGNTMKARQNELKAKHQHVSVYGFNHV